MNALTVPEATAYDAVRGKLSLAGDQAVMQKCNCTACNSCNCSCGGTCSSCKAFPTRDGKDAFVW